MKVFGLIMINKFICLGYGQRVKEAAMVEGFSFPKFNDTDVCQLVVEELKKAIAAWQVVGAEWRALPGCFIAVLLAYLECIDDPKLNPINKHVPRVLYYNPKKLMELARNDLIKKGTRDPRTWIFGKSPWKAQNDIVFNDEGSRVLPTNVRVHQNKRPISCIPELPPSPKRFKSGPSSSTGVAPQPSSGNFFASTFAELESALSRAAQLSFQLPTTTSRLACISGILPTEESFDEDAHRIVLNAEVGNHEHLQKTISQLRDGFSAYRNMQDSRCKPFEDRANHYFNQIFNEDSTAAAAATDSRREVVDPSEINVVNDDTLDLSQPLASKALVPNSDTPPEVEKTVDSEETLSNKKQDGGSEANAGVDDASSAEPALDPSLDGVQANASKDIAAVSASKFMESQLVPASTLFLPPIMQGAVSEEAHVTKLSADGKLVPSSYSIQDLVSYKLGDLPDGSNNIEAAIEQFYLRVTSIDLNSELAEVAAVGMYVIAEHFRGSKKIVCPYWVTYKIYHGDLSAGLRRWFRERAVDDRIDQKDLILFPTLDPPPSKAQHAGWAIFRRMVENIKKLWTDLSTDMDPPLMPLSIDHFPTNYMNTVKQVGTRACGWFMLTSIMSWDGKCLMDFSMKDIPNIKKMMLYCWAMSGKFKIDFVKMFGCFPGDPIPMDPDYFVILESQDFISQDKSIIISSQENFMHVKPQLPVFENAGNDSSGTDDFEVPTTRSRKKRVDSPAIKKKNTTGVSSDNIISVKRASKRAKKWSLPVEPLNPGKFIHLHKARLLMNFILSKHGREKFSEKTLCEFDRTDITGAKIPIILTGKDFVRNFDYCNQLEGEMMHYVISQWKSDPLKNVVFASGSRVLLSPYFVSDILGMDNMKSGQKFNLDLAIVNFHKFVMPGEDLLKAKLHRNVIDVLDSKDWPRQSKSETTRSEFHGDDIKEIEVYTSVASYLWQGGVQEEWPEQLDYYFKGAALL